MIFTFTLIAMLVCFWWLWGANYYIPPHWLFTLVLSIQLAFMVGAFSIPFASFMLALTIPATLGMYRFSEQCNPMQDAEQLRTVVTLWGLQIVFIVINQQWINNIYDVLPLVIISDGLFKLIPERFRKVTTVGGVKHTLYGITGNFSTTATTLSILYAVVLTHDYPYYQKELCTISLIWSLYNNKATAGMLGALGSAGLFLLWKQYYGLLGGLILIAGFILVKYQKKLIGFGADLGSGRIDIWKDSLALIRTKEQQWFGIGNGAYKFLMPFTTQQLRGQGNRRVTIWAHNDLLQFYVESGRVGIILLVYLLGFMLPHFGWTEWIIFVGLLPNLIFNFPLRLASTATFIVIIMKNFYLNH